MRVILREFVGGKVPGVYYILKMFPMVYTSGGNILLRVFSHLIIVVVLEKES